MAIGLVGTGLFFKPNQRASYHARKPPGSPRTLNTWAAQRDYPFSQGKDRPFFQAWDKSKRFRKAATTQKTATPWTPIGPVNLGGRTLVLAFDPTNPAIMFTGSASGGLWRSETGGLGAMPGSEWIPAFPYSALAPLP